MPTKQRTVKLRLVALAAIALVPIIGMGLWGPHALAAATSTTPTTTNSGTYHIMIMTHLCKSSIMNESDFEAMESGKSAPAALAADVLACPTTGLMNNEAASGTVASPRTTYDFSVTNNSGTRTLQENGNFMQEKLCESDLNLDVNGDGKISSSTCLDTSHYNVPVSASTNDTQILVKETEPPAGYHFGTLRFTPVALDGNNDSESFKYLDPASGQINLNLVTDKDGMVMLHVYDFQNASSTSNGSGNNGSSGSSGGNNSSGNTGMSGTGNSSLGSAINSAVEAQIQAIQARIRVLFDEFGSSSMNASGSSM